MMSYTEDGTLDWNRRILIVDNSDTTWVSVTATVREADPPTTASTSAWHDVDSFCYTPAIGLDVEQIAILLNEIRMSEIMAWDWKYQVYSPVKFEVRQGMFLPYLLNRRVQFSKSGYKGLKGRKFRN